ncbi:MAG: undecaprenyl-phosphate galactose phosphotransferase WbaP [Chloroflexi bacterium]|nr:undecaprenyl-phosphate galactose phosphotransferase WbaP [Chloroflexota bacterium]
MSQKVEYTSNSMGKDLDENLKLISCPGRNRFWMILILLTADFLSLILAGFLSIPLRFLITKTGTIDMVYQIIPVIFLCLVFYQISGLYPAVRVGPITELRLLITTTSAAFFVFAGITFFAYDPGGYSRLVLGFTWVLSLALVPAGRYLFRSLMSNFDFWGEPILVVGYGQRGRELVDFMLKQPQNGLRPVLAVVDSITSGNNLSEIPVLSVAEFLKNQDKLLSCGIKSALIIQTEIPKSMLNSFIIGDFIDFNRIIILPEVNLDNIDVTSYQLNYSIGLKITRNLLNPISQKIKRAIDTIGSIIGLILLFPIFLLIAILIKIGSRGPIFYQQTRAGKDAIDFEMIKFRTMFENADAVMNEYLTKDPELGAEWEKYQKLKKDPRVTNLGQFLRKYSLDELPQLWNVLIGEMSLVGPRPFLPGQEEKYGKAIKYYSRVQPGITGMWQVNERNESEFTRRPYWDTYYVNNWSFWLDLYILGKTFWVVIKSDGAY